MTFALDSQNVLAYLQGIDPQLVNDSSWPVDLLRELHNRESLEGTTAGRFEIAPKPGKNFNLRILVRESLCSSGVSASEFAKSEFVKEVQGALAGKNCDLLVKQEALDIDGKPAGELRQEAAFFRLLAEFPVLAKLRSHTIAPLHIDLENAILIFPFIEGAQDLSEYYDQFSDEHPAEPLPVAVAAAIGEAFGLLHGSTFQQRAYQAFWHSQQCGSKTLIPDFSRGLRRLTPELFAVLPSDALKFFRFYQRYPAMGEAIEALNEIFEPCCLVHDDPRFANVLLHSSEALPNDWPVDWPADLPNDLTAELPAEHRSLGCRVSLIDWEKWRWGDPAYDLGKLLANYLRLWLKTVPVSANMPLTEALGRASLPLEAIQPSLSQLVIAYLSAFPAILSHRPDFLRRLTRFIGLGLVRQVQLDIAHKQPIGNIEMAMTQVARSLLCQPDTALETIFGQPQAQLETAARTGRLKQAL